MQPNQRDSGSLWDMAQAIRLIQEFTTDVSCETYLESVFIQSAVERQLGILGEAARRVSIEFQQFHPEIDWRNAINLRNILVHRYDQVSSEVIWNIVTNILPSLLLQVEELLPALPDDRCSIAHTSKMGDRQIAIIPNNNLDCEIKEAPFLP